MIRYATTGTPLGPFTLTLEEDLISAACFGPPPAGAARTTQHLSSIEAYFAGDIVALDALPVLQHGTAHDQKVWAALRTIAAGTVWSYRELATHLGNAGAARAVGSACGRNPIAIIVPCHRVRRSDGTLGGYASGLDRKAWLLAHERAHA